MSDASPLPRVRLALDLDDPALADRIVTALADAAGIELVADAATADALIGPAATSRGRRGESDVALTARELQVLALMAEGASNKQIARRLGITPHTAKFHVGSLIDKLDAVSRTDAVAHAARLGVIDL